MNSCQNLFFQQLLLILLGRDMIYAFKGLNKIIHIAKAIGDPLLTPRAWIMDTAAELIKLHQKRNIPLQFKP